MTAQPDRLALKLPGDGPAARLSHHAHEPGRRRIRMNPERVEDPCAFGG